MTYDVGDYEAALQEALRLADVDALRAEQARRIEAGEEKLLGIGVSTYVEITGFGGKELGSVRIEPDGSATVMSGTSAHGQGHATSFAMIVADRLGIPIEQIRYVQSDTRVVPTGGGTGGSRSLQLGGSAVAAAAAAVRDQARELAAQLLEAAPEDLELTDAGFTVSGVPGAVVDWPALAAAAAERDTPLHAQLHVPQDGATFPFGAHVSVVEVDTETGRVVPLRHVAVDDCGRILNPVIVEGQQHGGIAQGISQALWEQFLYSEDGQPLTSTFADYQMPTAADTISFETANTETPTHLNELGAKGIGESGTIGSTPAVQSAVVDALRHLGVRHVDIPCTPERVWRAVQDARAGTLPDPWREPPAVFDTLEVQRARSTAGWRSSDDRHGRQRADRAAAARGTEIVRIAQAADEAGAYAVYIPDHFMPQHRRTTDRRRAAARGVDAALGALASRPSVVPARRRWCWAAPTGTRRSWPTWSPRSTTSAAGARSPGSARAGRSTSTRRTASTCCRCATAPTGSRRACTSWRRCCASRGRRSTGRFFQLHDAPNQPAPVQERLPVLVGGQGERRTLRTAAKYADVWHTWGTPESFAAKSAVLDERCAEIGRDPAEIRRATGFFVDDLSDGAATVAPFRDVCDEFVFGDVGDRPRTTSSAPSAPP